MLTLLLGLSLAASGVFKLVIALRTRAVAPYGLILVSGLLTLLVGLMILVRWPTSSLYVLGLFLGFDLVVAGVSWILLGLVSRGQSRKSA